MGLNKEYPLKPLELLFKRFSLLLGRLFFDAPEKPSAVIDPSAVRRVLFLRYDKLGDMVVSLPVFAELKRRYPDIELDVLASPSNMKIIADDPRVSNRYQFTKNIFKDVRTVRALRRRRYDVVVTMISLNSATSLYLSQLIGKRAVRIGLGQSRHARYYHHSLPVDLSLKEHMLTQTLRTLEPFGIDPAAVSPYAGVHVTGERKQRAGEIFEEWSADSQSGTEFIGVNISAGKPNRIWAEGRFVELLSGLARQCPQHRIALFFAPADRERAIRIQRESGGAARLLPPELDILQVAALTKRLALLITPDTSMTHIARSFAVPVIGLYSSHERNSAEWRPYGQSFGLVQANAEDDIFDITAEQVLAEVSIALSEVAHV